MMLPLADIAYIDTRLEEHEFKYQEVYDEIGDHVLLAIESARAGGDEREIELVYNDMMETQFPGNYPFERISNAYQQAYRNKIRKMVWANMRYYIKPLNALIIGLALVAGYFYMPENEITYILTLAVLLIVTVFPILYARSKSAKIETDDGKQSIIREQLMSRASVNFFNFYVVIIAFNLFRYGGLSGAFKAHHSPIVDLFIIAYAVIYDLSIIRLCRQEIKIPTININE